MTQSPAWRDHIWWSADGVRLHARVYDAERDSGKLPILCIPGLTRNARDFDRLAPHLARDRTVYALDIRGRGASGFAKDAMSYTPLTYLQDVSALLDELALDRFISIGTSLGGLVTMLIAATQGERLAGVVLNDVGPEIDPAGLDRIKTYVGQGANFPTWVHAARAIAATNAPVYPDWELEDWLTMAKRTHRLTPEGRIAPDYDTNIALPFKQPGGEAGVDLWPAFDAMKAVPTLVLRGALSDILSAKTATTMVARLDDARLVMVPRVGHAPTLDEPMAVAAIEALIAAAG
ncbi:MAG: alpha/beta hydrolase [Sphingopyxis sp.]